MNRVWTIVGLITVLALGGLDVAGATVTITNCATDPAIQIINKKTVINLPADDIVIQCPLISLPGSSKTQVTATAITVDGPNGGSVSSSGKGGMATLLKATSGNILINDARVTADDANGEIFLDAAANINITPDSLIRSGPSGRKADRITMNAGGIITIGGTVVDGNEILITATGTITVVPTSTFISNSPRDRIAITSLTGDVIISGGGAGGSTRPCCADLLVACQNPNNPSCPFAPGGPGSIQLNSIQELNAFCLCPALTPSRLEAGVEGSIYISAPQGKIDVSGTTITAGENVRLLAQTEVIAIGSKINNCGPRKGIVELAAATCRLQDATILDDDPETAPTLNCAVDGTPTLLGTCSSAHP